MKIFLLKRMRGKNRGRRIYPSLDKFMSTIERKSLDESELGSEVLQSTIAFSVSFVTRIMTSVAISERVMYEIL